MVGISEDSAPSTICHRGEKRLVDQLVQSRRLSSDSVSDYSASACTSDNSPKRSVQTSRTSLSSNSMTVDLPSPPGWTQTDFNLHFSTLLSCVLGGAIVHVVLHSRSNRRSCRKEAKVRRMTERPMIFRSFSPLCILAIPP